MRTIFTIILLFFGITIYAQKDTIYFIKDKEIVNIQSIKSSDLDSMIFYRPIFKEEPEGPGGTFTDVRDGNEYKFVTIGNQVWMAENLKFLPIVYPPDVNLEFDPACYVYGYEGTDVGEAMGTENYNIYGALYNWVAAMGGAASSDANPSGVQGVCPAGWHIPSNAEWTELADFLGGEEVAGDKLKETGTEHWADPNEGATNEVGFTALPGGSRHPGGEFYNLGEQGAWWVATEVESDAAIYRGVRYNNSVLSGWDYYKTTGYSVRCVKD